MAATDPMMRYETWPNLVTMFFEKAAERSGKPFLWAKSGGVYKPLSWGETAARVRALAAELKAQGLRAGDRVVLVSESRPEWLISDMAIMAAGGITVPAYTTNTSDDHLHILGNCGARAAIVSTPDLAARLFPAAQHTNSLDFIIAMEPPHMAQTDGFRLLSWNQALQAGAAEEGAIEELAAGLSRNDTACLIYTSGTGGAPKGVMLSHGAILSNCGSAYDMLSRLGLGDEVFLSFLPLCHSYEHTAGQFFPVSIGAQIYYAEKIETLGTNMMEAHPTLMTAVPRLYESLHQRITRGLAREGGLKEKLFTRALALGVRAYEGRDLLSPWEKVVNGLLDVLVRRKVRKRFGGRLKALISGGAPLNYQIGLFFTALGLRLLQGYGQTEAAPVISCNPAADNRIGTVGPALKGVTVKIANDGEILVKGELVMQGYWDDPQATAETIRDGWLHTGDIGEKDEDGYIRITDRKKDIIVNSGGDNISPQRIEGFLTLKDEVAQAMVHGDRRPHLVALIVPEENLAASPEARMAVDAAVARVNAELSPVERVRHFILAEEPFTVENGLMTPTMKIRRHKIHEIYGAMLEGLYKK